MLQTKAEIGIFKCIADEISAEKNLQEKNGFLEVSDAFIFLTR